MAVRLNLGAGTTEIAGFTPIDKASGGEVFPLPDYADESVDELRASHILEHFSYRQTLEVLREWIRVLKAGSRIKIAVPDFSKIVNAYEGDQPVPVEAYLMGGHVDSNDVHLAMFNEQKLRDMMREVGFVDIRPWKDDVRDCAGLPVSLNLEGTKPGPDYVPRRKLKILAVMSVPRLGFMDNFFSCFEALLPLGIGLRKTQGAFWGQCLERSMMEVVDEGVDAILTLDYDTAFKRETLEKLVDLMEDNPDADAIAPLQSSRMTGLPMVTIQKGAGENYGEVDCRIFEPPLKTVATAHFGLTLVRVSALLKMTHPWLKSEPAPDGTWGKKRIDADTYFWKKFAAAGCKLYQANHVCIGHLELMVAWPGPDLQTIYQHPSEFGKTGQPPEAWRGPMRPVAEPAGKEN